MFMKLETVKDLGLQEVRCKTIKMKELESYIAEYQCSINLMDDMNALMLKYICLIKCINYDILKDDVNKYYSGILWQDENFRNAFYKFQKHIWFSMEFKYSNFEELYPNVEMLINIDEFKSKANAYHKEISRLEELSEQNKLTLEEYNDAVEKAYITHGCNIYHEEYFNQEKYYKCINDKLEITDENYIPGFIKLYINPSELYYKQFELDVNAVENALKNLYILKQN